MSNQSVDSVESSETSVENQIIELAKLKPTGISNSDIKDDMPDTPIEIWTKVINKLLKSG